ncbi:MAG: helix-turn-helix domain-containing protein [Actinomycetota bacterium]|nr:helix-turn-helix domain-containing protein [Actinomycetota bacterium]
MTDAELTKRPGAEPIAAVLADRVRELRERRGLSQADLAARMAEHGTPWKRATVVNLEKRGTASRGSSGVGRDALTLQEWLHLALVLEVPPISLLADPCRGTAVPIAEGLDVNPWEALLWLAGLAGRLDDRPESATYRIEADLIWASYVIFVTSENFRPGPRPGQIGPRVESPEGRDRRHRYDLEAIKGYLQVIQDAGLTLPPLPSHVLKRAAEMGVELPGQDEGG